MIVMKKVAKAPHHDMGGSGGLAGIDLAVDRGDFLVITADSPQTGTALLRVIGLLDRVDSGSYELEGREVSGLGDRERALIRSRRFGFVFREARLLDELDVEGNVMLPMAYAGMPRHLRARRAKELLDRIGLSDRGTHRSASLSEKDRHLVSIARALANDPICLLVDDTGEGGSADNDIANLLIGLHGEGMSILLTGRLENPLVPDARLIRIMEDRAEELPLPAATGLP